MRKQLYINGTGSGTCGVYLNSDTFLNSPAIDFTEYQIPAVNGNQIIYNKRLNNVIRKFDCFINENVDTNLTKFKKLLYENNGYMKLESDYDTGTYQMGYLAQEIQVEPFRETKQIKFSLYFSCMPQKWFNTNSEKTLTVGTHFAKFWDVLPRDNKQVKEYLDMMPIDDVPTADYYAFYYLVMSEANLSNITNISATISDDMQIIVAYHNVRNNPIRYYNEIICYGKGSASKATFTTPYQSGNDYVYVIVPLTKTTYQVTASATTANGTQTMSYDISDNSTYIANSDAFGLSMDYEVTYVFTQNASPGTIKFVPFSTETSFNGTVRNQELIGIHFIEMDAPTLQDIYSRFATNNTINVLITSDNTATIIKGTDTMNITSYLEVLGNINGTGDKVVTAVYDYQQSNPGGIKSIKMKPRWWKL